jgi:N-acetylglucosaminyldiphosphoundecaprenol N-acetyl-beta-D-mannosaminyltransferase
MIDQGKKNILGVRVDAVDYDAAVNRLIEAAKEGRKYTTTALAVHGVMTGALDMIHRHRLNQLDMIVPDGMPVRWGLNLIHKAKLPDRVYGPELMLRCCEAAAEHGLPVYFYGTTRGTLEELTAKLQARFPKLEVAGAEPSQFRKIDESEAEALAVRIRNSGAKVTFVGLGCPRQEVWAYEFGQALQMPIFTVGAAFQFHAGRLSQAPRWMQNNGLEWFYRLVMEPSRLWKRYFFLNPAYLTLLGLQWSKIRVIDPENTLVPDERILHG